jgi:gliding motility-associated-like protein
MILMSKRYYILIFMIATAILSAQMVEAQNSDIVCPGAARMYKISPNPGSTYTWTVTGDSLTYQYGDSIEVIWGGNSGFVQVVEASSFGCAGAPVILSVQVSVPTVYLGKDLKVCEGKSVELDAGSNYPVHQWSSGDTSRKITVKTPGYYKVNVIDYTGCHATDSVYVSFVPNPKVNLGADTMICDNEYLELDAGTDGISYLWWDKATGQTHTIGASELDNTYVSVQVANADGCVSSDTMIVMACDYSKFPIPNTITPNGDGKNDTWKIELLGHYPNATVQIYDRWGQIVFQSSHCAPDNVWDGTSNGRKLPVDSYFYIINFKEGHVPRTGTISIVR